MADQLQYLMLMGLCLIITLPLEFVFRARVYRRPLRMLQAVLVTTVIFSIWDIIAIQFDLWSYSSLYTTGVLLPFALPLEELVFFVVISLCAILTYEAVGQVLNFFSSAERKKRAARKAQPASSHERSTDA